MNVAKKRTNIIPIIEDARHPHKYRMLMGECRVLFLDNFAKCFGMFVFYLISCAFDLE